MIFIDKLKKIAESASPGPWKIGYHNGSGMYDFSNNTFCLVNVHDDFVLKSSLCNEYEDAKFISEANPETILKLIEVIKMLEKTLLMLCNNCKTCHGCDIRIKVEKILEK